MGENRTIPVVNGVFTDTFATAATVHIYEVNDGPAAPIISTGLENSNASVTLTGTAPDGATVTVSDNGGATALDTVTASSTGAWSFTTAALPAGSYAFTATETTSAGTSGASSPFDVVVTNPANPVVSSIAESPLSGDLDSGNIVTLTLTFNELMNVTGAPTLTLNDGGTATYSSGSGSSALTFSYTVATGQNTSSLAVTSVNLPAGTTITNSSGAAAGLSLAGLTQTGPQIDTTAPAAPVISGDTMSGNTVTLNGTAEANSTITVFDNSTDLGTATTNSSGAWTYTTGALANGSQSFTATATDAAGNVSVASSPLALTLTGPLVANGNFATGDFTNWTLGGNYTDTTYGPEIFIDTDAEGGSTYAAGMGSVGSDGTLSQTIATTAGRTYTLSFWLQNEASGTNDFKAIWNGQTLLSLSNAAQSGYTEYTYTVTATGGTTTLEFSAANGPSQWDLDNISLTANDTVPPPPDPPAAPVISSGVANSNESVTLTGTAPDGSTVTVSDGGATTLGTATASSTGAWIFTTADLSAGTYAFTATDTTSAGTSAASSAFDVTVKPPPPAAPVISTGVANSNESVTLTGTAPDGSTVTVSDGGATTLGTATASSTGAWIFTTADLSAGTYAFTATDTTSAGTSAASSPLDVTVTPPLPAAPVISTGVANSNESVTLTGTAPDGSTVTVSDGGATALGTATASSTGAWSFTTADLSAGSYAFTATDTTSAGTSAASSAFDVTVKPPPPAAPVISTGVANSNESVTLTGTAPDGSTVTVSDGGATALGTATASSTGAWSFTTADLSAGTYAFTATDTTSAGTSAASSPLDVTVTPPLPAAPVISTGVANSSESVTLTGTAPDGSTVTVSDGGATTLGTATASSTGAWSFTTADLSAGSYAFTATDKTSAGTSAASSPLDVTVTPPLPAAPVISTGVANSSESVTLTGTAPDGSTVTVSDGGATTLGTATASSTGAWSFTTADLSAGSYAFTATDTTSAGTSAASSPFDVTVKPPAAPDIKTGRVHFHGADPSVTLKGTAPDGATVTVSDGGSTPLGTTTASSTGSWSFTTMDLAAGSYAFTATDTTSAGTSAASSPFDVTVAPPPPDPPAAPVISTGVANSNESATLTGTAPDGSAVTVSDGDATAIGTATASSTGAWSFTTADLSAGSYAFTATDTTSAGTSAASSPLDVTVPSSSPPSDPNLVANGNFATGDFTNWTLGGNYTDTTYGPEIFIDTDAEGGSTHAAGMGSVGSDGTLSQTIATTAGQTYTLSFWLQNEASGTNDFKAIWNGQTLLSLTNAAQSGYTQYTYTVTATGGTTTLEFSAANGPSQWDLDNISLTANGTSTTTPPPAASVIKTGVANSNESVTLTGTAPDGSAVTVSDGDATAIGTATASGTGAWSFATADLAAGSYAFTATDTTSTGTSAASSPLDVTVPSSSPPSDPNLVANGNFATGDFTNWTSRRQLHRHDLRAGNLHRHRRRRRQHARGRHGLGGLGRHLKPDHRDDSRPDVYAKLLAAKRGVGYERLQGHMERPDVAFAHQRGAVRLYAIHLHRDGHGRHDDAGVFRSEWSKPVGSRQYLADGEWNVDDAASPRRSGYQQRGSKFQ